MPIHELKPSIDDQAQSDDESSSRVLVAETQVLKYLRASVIAWILVYYTVPSTVFSGWSLGHFLMIQSIRFSFHEILIIVSIWAFAVILMLARRTPDNRDSNLPIWLPASILVARLSVGAWFEGQGPDGQFGVVSMLCAITTGIMIACVAQSLANAALGLALVSLLQAGYALIYVHTGVNTLMSGHLPRAIGTFEDPGNLYVLMLVAIPICLAGILEATEAPVQILLSIATSAAMAAFLLTWYREAAIALAISISWLVWAFTRSIRSVAIVLAVSVIFVGVTFFVRESGSVNSASAARSSHGHNAIILQGLEIFEKHPVSGVGVGNLELHFTSATNVPGINAVGMLTTPKNLLLFYLCEQGFLGFAVLSLLGWSVVSKLKTGNGNIACIGLAGAWIALIAAGVTDTPFGPASSYVGNCMFGLLIGLTAIVTLPPIQRRVN